MTSPAAKQTPSVKRNPVRRSKHMERGIASQRPLPGQEASEIMPPGQGKPINKPSTPTTLKKIRKLEKGPGTKELSPTTQEKKLSQIKDPNFGKTGIQMK